MRHSQVMEDDCSRCLDFMSVTRVTQDCRYLGAVPCMDRYVRMANLKEMHSVSMERAASEADECGRLE